MPAPVRRCSYSPRRRSAEGGLEGMTAVQLRRGGPDVGTADLLFLPTLEGELGRALAGLDRGLVRVIRRRASIVDFRGRPDDAFVQQTDAGRNRAIALLGLGRGPAGGDAWRRLGARAPREAPRPGARAGAAPPRWLRRGPA